MSAKRLNEKCIEKINNNKVLSTKTYNVLKDMKFDLQILLDDICNNIIDEKKHIK
jgi:hypothetical protein